VNVFQLKLRSEKFDENNNNERTGIKKNHAFSFFYILKEITLNFNKVTLAIESSN